MNWAKPENIIWLIFLPLFVGLAFYVFNWRKNAKSTFADRHLISKIFPFNSDFRFWLSIILISLTILFGVLALMDPLFGEEKIKVKREGIDIVYALDLSSSMNVEDVAPSRLEKAKRIISQSIQNLGGDRVGLIVFAADAYSISPLTNDYGAIQSYINSANSNLISQQGTNFSDVLQKAEEMFGNSPTTGKLLVILTDGEDNESSVSKASGLAKENNIHLAVLGIGTQNGGPIPNQPGDFEEYKMDRNGETVISKLDESSMKSLVGSTSGIYLRVNQTDTAVKNLHIYLNSLDKKTQDTSFSSDKKHVFQWFLALALIFIFIDTLTTEHKLFNNKK
jgi:Ca-activated chloride channel family protein